MKYKLYSLSYISVVSAFVFGTYIIIIIINLGELNNFLKRHVELMLSWMTLFTGTVNANVVTKSE